MIPHSLQRTEQHGQAGWKRRVRTTVRNDRRGERLRAAGNFRATTGIGAAEEIVRGHRRDGIACTGDGFAIALMH